MSATVPRPSREEGGEFADWDEARRAWMVIQIDPTTRREREVAWDDVERRWMTLREFGQVRRKRREDMTLAEAIMQVRGHCYRASRYSPSGKTRRALDIVIAAAQAGDRQ